MLSYEVVPVNGGRTGEKKTLWKSFVTPLDLALKRLLVEKVSEEGE